MRVILSLSGGMDSAVLLYHLLDQGAEVRCLTVDYGQRHRREILSAIALGQVVGVEHRIADLSNLCFLFAGSSQTSSEIPVPEGHYAEESMKQTVVPNRNMVLLSLCTAWAVATKSHAVAYAAHAGDHAIYPDCRPEFTQVMSEAMKLCDWHSVQLLRPFLHWSKGAIAKRGKELGVPLELTWTCYVGLDRPCGKCGSCCERAEAMTFAEISDPLLK